MSTTTLTERAEEYEAEVAKVVETVPFLPLSAKAFLCEGATLMKDMAARLDHITPHIDEA